MARTVVPLTDARCRNAKTPDKEVKLFDGGGLYLRVDKGGNKGWRFKYIFLGKECRMSFGNYPTVSLAEARVEREKAKKLLIRGENPAGVKQAKKLEQYERQANTFERLAAKWIEHRAGELAKTTQTMIERRLSRDINPAIGRTPLDDLTPRLILEKVLRPMEIRGANDLAHRVGSIISQIMRFGVSCGLLDRDPTTDLRGALKPILRGHHAALDGGGTPDPIKVGALLRALDGYDGTSIVKCALRLHPLVATRPGELRHAEWSEIDFDQQLWEIPAGKMKMKQPHVVPLSRQAIAVLRDLEPVTGKGQYLFHSVRTVAKPISNNSLNAALRRLGYTHDEFVPHGWRAVFRTLADEVLRQRVDIIEAQLAHQVRDTLGRSYNRTSFLDDRKELMQLWADYLDGLKQGERK